MTKLSLQAKIVKRLLPLQFSGWSDGSIEEQRARQEKSMRFNRLPAGVACQAVDAGGVPAEWSNPTDPDRGVILYLHGGAYALGSLNTHREFVARLSSVTNQRCLSLAYRLAPEHPYPAAIEDGLTGFRWLLTQGYGPSQITLAGDSAGGGLVTAILLALRDASEPLPACAVCISPWTDLTLSGDSINRNASADKILQPVALERYARYYAGEYDLASPLISPFFAELGGLPPLLIQVGTDEILLDDARRFAARAEAAGVAVSLELWEEMFHVFQIVAMLPETKAAVQNIAAFIAQNRIILEKK